MKKVLFATSALVAFAGAASAEVAVSGDARIGMRYDSDLCANAACTTTDSAWNVVNRARVKFTMTGTSDSGLEFGAEVRAEEAQRARYGSQISIDETDGTVVNSHAIRNGLSADKGIVWVSGQYGKLTAGDIDSGMENALGDLPEVGLTGLDFLNEFGYSSSDFDDSLYSEAGLLYEYSINGVKLFASFMDQNIGYSAIDRDNNAYSLGAKYEMAGYEFGIGYEKSDFYIDPVSFAGGEFENNSWGISAATVFNEVKVKGIYMTTTVKDIPTLTGDLDVDQFGVGAEYKMANGVGLSGFWRRVAYDTPADEYTADAVGLGASYDLGGGATIKGGIVNVSGDDALGSAFSDRTMADFGLAFKF